MEQIRIRLKSYDYKLLDHAVKDIVLAVRRMGAEVSGPIPLVTDIEKFTVNTSPHVFKKSREQFEIRRHKRLIIIKHYTPQTIDVLKKIELSGGIDAKIELVGDGT